jgi:hypothetical protein
LTAASTEREGEFGQAFVVIASRAARCDLSALRALSVGPLYDLDEHRRLQPVFFLPFGQFEVV